MSSLPDENPQARQTEVSRPGEKAADIAIIGMSCFLPRAGSLRAYWQNILQCRDAITEVPLDHWDWRLYYDPDSRAPGKINSKWGGFLDDVPFDPLKYGMPPASLTSIEPLQLLLLEAVRRALDDAGYSRRPFDRERTAVILGAGGGAAQLSMAYAFDAYLPLLDTVPGIDGAAAEVRRKCRPLLPQWTEDTFPGILLNVAAGRVANRFDFGGACFSVDAACGSSLAALYVGARELQAGASDVAVVMGGDTVQNPFTYRLFSSTNTFSPSGRSRPFDESADGIVISEGVGVVILKRLADARQDGDRIYAVIKGVGSSSDGKDRGLTAPRPEGQMRAIRRAYAAAGVSPARVGLVEAHGTGTVVGDRSEVESAAKVFGEAGARQQSCAIGSVKSMIGHTKCAAGLAGLINATLALHHKVRPPMLIDRPNSKADFPQSPFFVNTRPRPWVHGNAQPRCAGVSAFGFGGTNFHAVLEEYTGNLPQQHTCGLPSWPAELLVWRRPTRRDLLDDVQRCREALAGESPPTLDNLAASLWETSRADAAQPLLAIVASSAEDLEAKLTDAATMLRSDKEKEQDPRGIYFNRRPAGEKPAVAFLFPGQGSQHPDMLAQLAMAFAEVRRAFDQSERILEDRLERPLGSLVFPPSAFSEEEQVAAARALMQSEVAQPAVGAASLGIFRLLEQLGIVPDYLAGHSYGDIMALCAAGALGEEDMIRLSRRRGQAIVAAAAETSGGMVAVEAGRRTCEELLCDIEKVTVANLNAPRQIVISGTEAGLERAMRELDSRKIRCRRIDVSCPFHSPFVAAAREPLAAALAECQLAAPRRPVYSNTSAAPFPQQPAAIAQLLVDHLTSPVKFQAEIEAMYAEGARLFVEVGPQAVLTGLVGQILSGRPHLAVASNRRGREDLVQLQHLLGQLLIHGVDVRLEHLFAHRDLQPIALGELGWQSTPPALSPTTWLVNSSRVRPHEAAEPAVLGRPQADADSATGDAEKGVTGSLSARLCQKTESRAAKQSCHGCVSRAFTDPGAPDTDVAPRFQIKPGVRDEKPKGTVPFSLRENRDSPRHENWDNLPPIQSDSTLPTPAPSKMPTADLKLPDLPADVDEAARVMLGFQDLMSQFLQTQRSVMEDYFEGSSRPLSDTPPTPHRDRPESERTSGLIPEAAPQRSADPEPPAPAAPAGEEDPPPAEAPSDPPDNARGRSAGTDRQALTDQLLELVSERTGYPPESLNLDLNLEGDLGVDSIKRVEILSGLVAAEGNGGAGDIEMETLTSLKSLREIIDYLMEADVVPSTNGIHRMLVRPVPIDPLHEAPDETAFGPLLVTDDGRGVAEELARRLRVRGQQVAMVAMEGWAEEQAGQHRFAADLTDPEAVQQMFERVRQQVGEVSGLVHLLPLAEPSAKGNWRTRICREVKSLFLLARQLARRPAEQPGGDRRLLLAATAMGGCFGAGAAALPDSFFPGQGGVAGLVKSLAHEWPEALVRVVDFDIDFDAGEPAENLAARMLAEMGDRDGPVEVGYTDSKRITLECVPAPVDTTNAVSSAIDSESTILVTGGARGITAAVVLELARRYRPRLVLVGRSPLPAEEEAEDTASLTEPGELKAALMARLRRQGESASPAEVDKLYRRLLQDREIRANLAAFEKTGARVHYYQADVRDEKALAGVIREVEERLGGFDGVIHGAGVIDDKLIGDKTPQSYDYVFGTKLDSALNISRLLRPERLKFCAFFASVAGRFGNRGQSDYAAANEVLSKLAAYLDRQWPGRVVSVVWGPWSRIGMVSELEEHLSRRGLQLIPPEVGPLRFDEELRYGRKGECEVVIAGEVGQLGRPRRVSADYATVSAESSDGP